MFSIMKKYFIIYCNDKHILDTIEANSADEAIDKICDPVFFQAIEVREK